MKKDQTVSRYGPPREESFSPGESRAEAVPAALNRDKTVRSGSPPSPLDASLQDLLQQDRRALSLRRLHARVSVRGRSRGQRRDDKTPDRDGVNCCKSDSQGIRACGIA